MEEIARFGGKHSFAMLWRFNPEWYRLIGTRCKKCGMVHYPRRLVCVNPCDSQDMEDVPLGYTGEIVYAGLNNRATDGYADAQPQIFANIKLDSGPHLAAELVNLPFSFVRESAHSPANMAKLKGAKVRMVIRRFRKHDNGDITYGHKFELVDSFNQ